MILTAHLHWPNSDAFPLFHFLPADLRGTCSLTLSFPDDTQLRKGLTASLYPNSYVFDVSSVFPSLSFMPLIFFDSYFVECLKIWIYFLIIDYIEMMKLCQESHRSDTASSSHRTFSWWCYLNHFVEVAAEFILWSYYFSPYNWSSSWEI